MLQSWVEIEHYSVAYFDSVIVFEARAGLIRAVKVYECMISLIRVPPLMEVLHYSTSNAITRSKYATE